MRDLRFAVRLLTRSPGFAFIAVLTLALGMGANTAFFSVLYGVVLAEPPYPDAARLISIRHVRADTSVPDSRLSRAEVRDVRERARAFEGVAAAALGRATLTATGEGEGLAERVKVSEVTPNLFSVLGVSAIRGRTFLDTDGIAARADAGGAQVAVISAGLWQSHFGGAADVLSRTVRLNGIGSALGFGLGTLMSGLLFGVSPDDPATFWAALATIGLTALAATVAPLYQAVGVNPAVILKAE